MSLIDDSLNANKHFADEYDPARAKPPAPRVAIVTCMDPRLNDILPMLGIAAEDADVIRNAGTVIDDDSIR
jgi:carbonic anhydrase